MKANIVITLSILATVGILTLISCSKKNPPKNASAGVGERTGVALDEAAKKSAEKAETTVEAIKENTKKVIEKTGEVIEKAGAAVEKSGVELQK